VKTILLYGFLGRQFGRVHHYEVASPAEAVRALCATLKGFRKAVVDGGAYRVLVGGKQALSKDEVPYPVSDRESIRIVPVIAGAGRGVGQVLTGAAIILGAGLAFSFLGLSAGLTYGAASLGLGLVVSGVAQMLFAPKTPDGPRDKPENLASYAFDGAVNTAAQGNPVPLLYGGPLIVGSQVISAGLSAEQI
jgi:predicted phage tail protein